MNKIINQILDFYNKSLTKSDSNNNNKNKKSNKLNKCNKNEYSNSNNATTTTRKNKFVKIFKLKRNKRMSHKYNSPATSVNSNSHNNLNHNYTIRDKPDRTNSEISLFRKISTFSTKSCAEIKNFYDSRLKSNKKDSEKGVEFEFDSADYDYYIKNYTNSNQKNFVFDINSLQVCNYVSTYSIKKIYINNNKKTRN